MRAFPRGSEGQFHFALDSDARTAQLVERVGAVAAAIGTPSAGTGGVAVTLPGWGGHSGLHSDLDGSSPPVGEWDGALFTWPLTPWEGMRVVPGSHLREPEFQEAFAGAIAPHPDEVHVEASPGDVVVTSVHLWKSGTLNRTRERRSEIWIGFQRDASV